MATVADTNIALHERSGVEAARSWMPMITIALGQVLMSFNVASLPVALSGMVESFRRRPPVRLLREPGGGWTMTNVE